MKASRQRSALYSVAGALILLVAGLRWAWNLPQHMDVTFGDEAQYLRYGLDLFHSIHKDWGPSYNWWYKLLSCFQSNPIKLFYLNYQVTAILIVLLLYFFLLRYGIRHIISIWLSFCFLLSTTVIDTWPRVSHFAVIVLLAFLLATKDMRSDAKKLLLLTLAFYIAAYARPELFSSFVLIGLVTCWYLFKERSGNKAWIPTFIFVVAFITINFIIYQLPANSYKGIDRTYIAFCQHYAVNYVIEHKAQFNPISEWIAFAHQTFGQCTDFGCILKTHGDLVLHNTLLNLKNYVFTLMQFVIGVLFPVKIIGMKKLQLLVFAGFIGLLLFVLLNATARRKLTEQIRANALLLLVLFLFGLPSMGTSVLIFPRQHYLLMHAVLLIFLIALVLNSVSVFEKINPAFALLLFIPLLIKSPKSEKYTYYQLERENKQRCNAHIVEYLTSHNDGKPHVVFSNHLSFSMLLPANYSDFNTEYEYKPGMQFRQVLEEKRIDHIVVRDILLHEKLLNADTSWTNFMKDPSAYGFKKEVYCDSCESYLLVKR